MTGLASTYQLGCFALTSEIPLPELPECESGMLSTLAHAEIRIGSVPFVLEGGAEVDPYCLATVSEYLLRIPGVARYRVSNGNQVVVEPEQNALPLNVRTYLLGTIFAVLCHQRGFLPLHASAVSTGDGVAAFLGQSGQGKSSLAANLARRGFQVVADDICLVDTRLSGLAVVIPSAPSLKLWRASLEQLGRQTEGLAQVFSEEDKYRLPIENASDQVAPERKPLRKLFILEDREDEAGMGATENENGIEIKEITPLRALPLLMNLLHQAYLLEGMGKREETFVRCGQILSQAKAYRLLRPWGFRHMDRTVDAIERFLREDALPATRLSPQKPG